MTLLKNNKRLKLELFLVFLSILFASLMEFSLLPMPFVINIQFYLLLLLVLTNYLRVRRFNLYQIWILGFIFIILSEMLILLSDMEGQLNDYRYTFFYLLMANNSVLLGYFCFCSKKIQERKNIRVLTKSNTFIFLIIVCLLFYLYSSLTVVIKNLMSGRQVGDVLGASSLLGIMSTAMGLILPSLIAYYFRYVKRGSLWVSFLLVLPIFVVQLVLATRFHLLFSVIPYLIITGFIDLAKHSFKKNVIMLLVLLTLGGVSSFLKNYRYKALLDISIEAEDEGQNDENVTIRLAREMSPEGVVAMTQLANEYFDTHPLLYGKEISFILYFWVPRSIWPTKPTPIDHWLIRKYERVPEGHSTASGFTGELRADFGIVSLFFVFFIGLLLKRGDVYIEDAFSSQYGSYEIVLAAILFPYVFFCIRSPLTATQSLIFELVIYKVFAMLYTKRIKIT